ncbi:NAD(P)-dependent oxidoreductase [Pseudonocardia acaciae]|uniref:NAD(P)-dependent oxidoreductase n=1 Tax=Pseudonocardia acaciae TaxID=551276 RepID=UPI0004921D56|nr:NAD(P)H-binding protein [Pseudonocardia acaciae]
MRIGVIGASGNIGQRVVAEALRRGHQVTGFTRPASTPPDGPAGVTWRALDVLDPASVTPAIAGLDVLVSAYQPGNAANDLDDTVARSIADPSVYVTAARSLLTAMESYPVLRLIVIGGAGSLELRPGVTGVDDPDALRAGLVSLGLPPEYEAAVHGHRDALNTYRTSNRLWTYLSPAQRIEPGERTGRFRLGGDQVLLDANGESRISYEDFAVALVDEAELPRHVQRRFTVAY